MALLAEVDDPRRAQVQLHFLSSILLIATLAVICGADGWNEVDLLGCQTRIAQTIRDRGADYVLALKGHQPHLLEAVVETFALEQAESFEGCDHDFHWTVNKNYGRIESRRCWAIEGADYLPYADPEGCWPDLRNLIMVQAEQRVGGEVASESRYYISSLPPGARALLGAVRGHRDIETALHWVLDMAFRADESRICTECPYQPE